MKNDPKGMIAAILLKAKEKMPKPEMEDEEGMGDKEIASEEILSAIKSNDPVALMEALTAFINCCEMED